MADLLAKFDMLKLVAICFALDFRLESMSWRLCISLSVIDFGGILVSNDSKLSSLVPRIVIFLRMAEVCRIISGPDCGRDTLSAIMVLMSSASLDASLYSFTHGSDDDAIPG